MVLDARGLEVQGAGESEIDDLDAVILRDQYVLRLDVAMDDAAGVGVFEGGGDFAGIAQPRALGERSGQAGAQRHAFDVLHDQPGDFTGLADIVERGDIGMGERGGGAGFAQKAGRGPRRCGQGRG